MRLFSALFAVLFILFFLFLAPSSHAVCQNFENNCSACQGGNQNCNGTDDQTRQLCTVHQSCNLSSQRAIRSCDCASGSYESGAFEIEGVGACGAPTQCIGDTGIAKSGLSGPTCHYCATPLETPIPDLKIERIPATRFQTDSNVVSLAPPIPGLTLKLTGPQSVENNQEIAYGIELTTDSTLQVPIDRIILSDKLPANTVFVKATGSQTFENDTVTWLLKDNQAISTTAGSKYTFSLVLKPTQGNTLVSNVVSATTILTVGGDEQPNGNTCNGKYHLIKSNPLGNFGDPSCTFSKDDLYLLLKQEDPAHADFWFNRVVPCESGYYPSAYRNPNILPRTPDPNGAWGLYQMGSDLDRDGNGRNGPLDRGDVPWQKQTTNAVGYSKRISSIAAYWACAR